MNQLCFCFNFLFINHYVSSTENNIKKDAHKLFYYVSAACLRAIYHARLLISNLDAKLRLVCFNLSALHHLESCSTENVKLYLKTVTHRALLQQSLWRQHLTVFRVSSHFA